MQKHYANAAELSLDPIGLAETLGLVGKHDPYTRALIGAWRWPGIWENRANIRAVVSQPYVVDLGGTAGAIGYGAIIVDYEDPERKTLFDLPGPVNAIFSSHTLEHVEDLDLLLHCCRRKLDPTGQFIAFVPSWKSERLWHRNWPYHRHTFRLGDEEGAPPESECIREVIEPHFPNILFASYTKGGGILVIAEKQGDT